MRNRNWVKKRAYFEASNESSTNNSDLKLLCVGSSSSASADVFSFFFR